ncbi:hypothetical protein J5226_02055 [Lysobacter sp. K5869]|uniref:Imm57 family immunity protein n=1 Tax=Lysobacter sp. K5869 TaxID=2820808 RepID=UPI001C05F2B7|nr:Imm57 family immunity protein [Lysobacter sp. K5869]QWP77212.1 hypothetical protein J5226_02055 [Lysobacter sp. K5869]
MKNLTLMCAFFLAMPFAVAAKGDKQGPGGSPAAPREVREIKMADQAVLETLALSVSPSTMYRCSKSAATCSGPNKASLGLALLAARNSKASLEALAQLVRYQLDGEISEDFTCHISEKGKAVAPYLINLNPERLLRRCVDDLGKFKTNSGLDIPSGEVCSDVKTISEKKGELIEMINSRSKCANEDF